MLRIFILVTSLFCQINLDSFVNRARRTLDFFGCTELGKVAEVMVNTGMCNCYKLVYRLVELTLILLVATTSVENGSMT
jgi:hypothetical protein